MVTANTLKLTDILRSYVNELRENLNARYTRVFQRIDLFIALVSLSLLMYWFFVFSVKPLSNLFYIKSERCCSVYITVKFRCRNNIMICINRNRLSPVVAIELNNTRLQRWEFGSIPLNSKKNSEKFVYVALGLMKGK